MDRGGGQRASPHCGPGPAPDRKSLVATSAGWVGHHVLDADIRDYFGSDEAWRPARLGPDGVQAAAAGQDGFALYLQGFVVTDDGKWSVVQQGNRPLGYDPFPMS